MGISEDGQTAGGGTMPFIMPHFQAVRSAMLEGFADWESVPDDVSDQWVGQFIHEQLLTQCQHRRARLIGVLCKSPDPVCAQCRSRDAP